MKFFVIHFIYLREGEKVVLSDGSLREPEPKARAFSMSPKLLAGTQLFEPSPSPPEVCCPAFALNRSWKQELEQGIEQRHSGAAFLTARLNVASQTYLWSPIFHKL